MGNTAATHDELLEHIRQALVGAGGPDHIVRWEVLLSGSGDVGSLPSQIARDLGVPEAYVLSGVLPGWTAKSMDFASSRRTAGWCASPSCPTSSR
jgi:hypothetical protein